MIRVNNAFLSVTARVTCATILIKSAVILTICRISEPIEAYNILDGMLQSKLGMQLI